LDLFEYHRNGITPPCHINRGDGDGIIVVNVIVVVILSSILHIKSNFYTTTTTTTFINIIQIIAMVDDTVCYCDETKKVGNIEKLLQNDS
jgi:hypothetical protein